MTSRTKRHAEIRLLVIVTIDITSDELAEALKARHRQPSSLADVVGQEVVSNLESVPYVDTAIVSHL
jgi:hypothetical protein